MTHMHSGTVNGTVLDIHPCPEDVAEGSNVECRQATVRVDAGADKGAEIEVMLPIGHNAPEFDEGDDVVLAALAGLGVSVLVLTIFVIPALLNGKPSLAVAVVGAAVITVATLYLSHGRSARTSTALLGTLISLTLTGAIGYGSLGIVAAVPVTAAIAAQAEVDAHGGGN